MDRLPLLGSNRWRGSAWSTGPGSSGSDRRGNTGWLLPSSRNALGSHRQVGCSISIVIFPGPGREGLCKAAPGSEPCSGLSCPFARRLPITFPSDLLGKRPPEPEGCSAPPHPHPPDMALSQPVLPPSPPPSSARQPLQGKPLPPLYGSHPVTNESPSAFTGRRGKSSIPCACAFRFALGSSTTDSAWQSPCSRIRATCKGNQWAVAGGRDRRREKEKEQGEGGGLFRFPQNLSGQAGVALGSARAW